MRRAVIADELGTPDLYRLDTSDPGQPGPGEVRVAIRAAGISFVDVLTAAGKYQVQPSLPFIPGSEGAGQVEALGEGVEGFAVGDRVAGSRWGGLFAEAAIFPQATLRRIPDDMSYAEAAVFPVSYLTAWHALVDRAQIRRGETLLVLGAGGAVGYAAVQIGRHLGARVIGSASTAAKRDLARAGGADETIEAGGSDWRDQVKAANGGKLVDVVLDPVGGSATEPAFRSLAWNGRHLVVGFPAGIAALRTNLPLLKGASLIGVDVRQFGLFEPELSEAHRATIFTLAGEGILRPAIAKTFPLDQFRDAMTEAAAGSTAGRIVLLMG